MLDALKVMTDSKVGAVLVLENRKIVGIFTERDYLEKGELVGKCSKTTLVKDLNDTTIALRSAAWTGVDVT